MKPTSRLRALVTDFDGTLAHDGTVTETTLRAIERWNAPPVDFVARLYERRLPLHIGAVIVSTWDAYEKEVIEVIDELSLDFQVIPNKGALMILPRGVDKATRLEAASRQLALEPSEVAGIGDAENDQSLLRIRADIPRLSPMHCHPLKKPWIVSPEAVIEMGSRS
jgi:hydroxymethylpyrimidine pyrophosphatase-like HAD family hydrolase